MITAQLLLFGTPEELQEVLVKLNGSVVMTEAESKITSIEVKPIKGKIEQTKMDLSAEEPEVETTTVTIEELRSEIQTKAKVGKRDDIKKLLKEFGAASVTELDEEHYGEFKLKLDKI